MKRSEKMKNLADISVIIPVYNEQLILHELYDRLRASVLLVSPNYELLFVNDGSMDTTVAVLKSLSVNDPKVKFISLSRNFGHQVAVSAGLDHCRGKAVVIIDGDLQDPPELIPELYAKYREGFKVVYAKRRRREGETWFKLFAAKTFYRILARLTNVDIPIDTGDFRLIDEKVVHYLRQMPEKNKFIRGQVAWIGFSQVAVEFDRAPRRAGETGYPFGKLLKLAMDGITSFSDAPLKVATWAGFLVSALAFIIILYALVFYFFMDKPVTGWTSLIISMMFVGGVQLLSIGIIGEYVSRIVANVRNRPLYIIEETNVENLQGENEPAD